MRKIWQENGMSDEESKWRESVKKSDETQKLWETSDEKNDDEKNDDENDEKNDDENDAKNDDENDEKNDDENDAKNDDENDTDKKMQRVGEEKGVGVEMMWKYKKKRAS